MDKMFDTQFKLAKRRDFGDLFNDTFRFIKENFKNLAQGILYFVVPFAVVQGIYAGINLDSTIESSIGGHHILTASYWINILFSLTTTIMAASFVLSYLKAYHQQGGGKIEISYVWTIMKSRLANMFIASILSTILFAIGLIILIIPGIYFFVCFSILPAIIVFEDYGVGDSISECFSVIKNNWWNTFGFVIVVGILSIILQFIPQLPVTIYSVIRAAFAVYGESGAGNTTVAVILSLFQTCATVFVTIVPLVAITLKYFSLKEEKDSPSLLKELDGFGEA